MTSAPSYVTGWWSPHQLIGRGLGTALIGGHPSIPHGHRSLNSKIMGSREWQWQPVFSNREWRQPLLSSVTQIMLHSTMKPGQAPYGHHRNCIQSHQPVSTCKCTEPGLRTWVPGHRWTWLLSWKELAWSCAQMIYTEGIDGTHHSPSSLGLKEMARVATYEMSWAPAPKLPFAISSAHQNVH